MAEKLSLSANDIANEVLRETRTANQGNLFQALNVEQLKAHVYRARRAEFADWAARIESFPLVYISPSGKCLFLQFNITMNVKGQLHCIIGRAHPDLIFQLKGGKVRDFWMALIK